METFAKGDIVIIPYPFSDLSGIKYRPALIIAKLQGDDVILCQITSQETEQYGVKLDYKDYFEGTLLSASSVRPNKLLTAHKSTIREKVCKITSEKVKEVENKIVEIIRT